MLKTRNNHYVQSLIFRIYKTLYIFNKINPAKRLKFLITKVVFNLFKLTKL